LAVGCERLEARCLLAAGLPDTSWNVTGRTTTDFGVGNDRASAVVLQSDGKVVAGGMAFGGLNDDFALVRYNRDGTLDTSFGTGGRVTTNFGIGDDRILTLALQPDGKIIAGGKAFNGLNFDFALARYNENGTLDASFGVGGLVATNLGTGDDVIAGVTVLPDGRIVAAGSTFGARDSDFAVARYLSNGFLDPTFSGDGIVTTDSGRGDDAANGLVVQPDGRIVVVGSTMNGSAEDFGIMRYLTDGSPDPGFGTNGGVATVFGNGSDRAFKVALTPGGKIVVVGTTDNGLNLDFAVARYLPNGSLDTSFDSDGKLSLDFNGGDDIAFGVAVQPNGRIVVAGTGSNGSNANFALARFNSNGGQDTSFSIGGSVLTQFGTFRDATARAVSIQANGRIVVAGFASNGTNDDFAVARFQGDALQRMYRLYNPVANFHFFTTSQAEFQFAAARGYRDETTARTGFSVAETQQAGSLPLHRLYNPIKGSHYYTTNDSERDVLVSLGWRYERDEGFVFSSQVTGTVEVFRLWNRDSGVHLFTESPTVRDAVLRAFPGIWEQHASVGFAYPVSGLGEAQAAARSATVRSAASRGVESREISGNRCDTSIDSTSRDASTSDLASRLAIANAGSLALTASSSTLAGNDARSLPVIASDTSVDPDHEPFDLAWEEFGPADWPEF
jgi:uncharacterized delta-60 repeat protein